MRFVYLLFSFAFIAGCTNGGNVLQANCVRVLSQDGWRVVLNEQRLVDALLQEGETLRATLLSARNGKHDDINTANVIYVDKLLRSLSQWKVSVRERVVSLRILRGLGEREQSFSQQRADAWCGKDSEFLDYDRPTTLSSTLTFAGVPEPRRPNRTEQYIRAPFIEAGRLLEGVDVDQTRNALSGTIPRELNLGVQRFVDNLVRTREASEKSWDDVLIRAGKVE
jgi:hypothetical protein